MEKTKGHYKVKNVFNHTTPAICIRALDDKASDQASVKLEQIP
jgi:hypothetical protein